MEEQKFEFYVAGVQHHNLHTVLQEVVEGDFFILEPEPTNKFDKNAIKILYPSHMESGPVMVGYIPGKISAQVSVFLATAGNPICEIIKFSPHEKPWSQLKVRVVDTDLFLEDDVLDDKFQEED